MIGKTLLPQWGHLQKSTTFGTFLFRKHGVFKLITKVQKNSNYYRVGKIRLCC